MKVTDYLKKIEKHGFSCYIVGGYVRDHLLGIESNDVDITTSAQPKDLALIFPNSKNSHFGCTNIKDGTLNIDITTYRKESDYHDRHPEKIVYIDDVLLDLKRRDFTINTICMDRNGMIFDPLNGQEDLRNGILRVVGDIPTKFKEDPLRMLRALRFSIIYNLKLEDSALEFIKNNMHLFKTISHYRRKEELSKILISDRPKEGLIYLRDLGILNIFDIKIDERYGSTHDLMGAWATLEFSSDYPFTKNEKSRIKNIREILNSNKIDVFTLFKHGLYDTTIAGELLGISKKDIEYLWNNMTIHHIDEIDISGSKIKEILNIESGPVIKDVKKDLINKILSGNLSNNEEELSSYIIENWK